jgi:tetratricopeptide (TPR) repeat protein
MTSSDCHGGFASAPPHETARLLLFVSAVCLAILIAPSTVYGQTNAALCGSLDNGYGPYDYANHHHRTQRLPIVERFHFGEDVVSLRDAGRVPDHLGRNIAYVLHAFPNHHAALDAMSRLGVRQGREQPLGARYSIECYFERATRWNPRDPKVKLVHAIHHYRNGRLDQAVQEALVGLSMSPDDPEIHYNLGLFLFRKGEYAQAREYGKRAYELGYPLPGLRDQLGRVGYWD